MDDFARSVGTAVQLVIGGDAELVRIVWLSLAVSALASLFATVLGLLAGAALAVWRFPGRSVWIVLLNTLLALPSVVVGLVVYLLLSRAGPLGAWGMLFTPPAMVIAQTLLVTPIVAALTRQAIEDALRDHGEQLRSLGARPLQCAFIVAWDERIALLTIALVAFGRAVSEVGAVMMVGGNIAGVTRVMTTAIALETSKGDLPMALALGLVLLFVVLLLNVLIGSLRGWRVAGEQRAGVAG
jgi:tungstate transport system permease protein